MESIFIKETWRALMGIRQPFGASTRRKLPRRRAGLARIVTASCLTLTVVARAPASAQSADPPITSPNEAPFLSENDAAMSKMMAGMAIKPSGDVDRDFVSMMVPHHQGAINMAIAVLRYGHNEQIRRLAQEIIVDQQQEIAARRAAVGEPLPPAAPAPTTPSGARPPMPGIDMNVR
jgi:hypothetical protein